MKAEQSAAYDISRALFFCLLLTNLVKTCKFRYEVDSSPRLCG